MNGAQSGGRQRKRARTTGLAVVVAVVVMLAVTACGSHTPPPPYEVAVSGWDPVYCYRTLADPDCTDAPLAGEAGRLVNYYGPSPGSYPTPPPSPAPRLHAPPPIDTFVRDPEPVLQPSSPRPAAP